MPHLTIEYTANLDAAATANSQQPIASNLFNNLIQQGVEVRIFTARMSLPEKDEQQQMIASWTQRVFGVPLQATCIKDQHCVAIVDDLARHAEHNTGRLR